MKIFRNTLLAAIAAFSLCTGDVLALEPFPVTTTASNQLGQLYPINTPLFVKVTLYQNFDYTNSVYSEQFTNIQTNGFGLIQVTLGLADPTSFNAILPATNLEMWVEIRVNATDPWLTTGVYNVTNTVLDIYKTGLGFTIEPGEIKMNAPGSILISDASRKGSELLIGTAGKYLSSDGTKPIWADAPDVVNMTNDNAVPVWNGSNLVDGQIQDDAANYLVSIGSNFGSQVSIGTEYGDLMVDGTTAIGVDLLVAGNVEIGSSSDPKTLTLNGNDIAGDLSKLQGVIAGTVTADKAVIVDANKDITGFGNITADEFRTTNGATDGLILGETLGTAWMNVNNGGKAVLEMGLGTDGTNRVGYGISVNDDNGNRRAGIGRNALGWAVGVTNDGNDMAGIYTTGADNNMNIAIKNDGATVFSVDGDGRVIVNGTQSLDNVVEINVNETANDLFGLKVATASSNIGGAATFEISDPANNGIGINILHQGAANGTGLYIETSAAKGIAVNSNNGEGFAADFNGNVAINMIGTSLSQSALTLTANNMDGIYSLMADGPAQITVDGVQTNTALSLVQQSTGAGLSVKIDNNANSQFAIFGETNSNLDGGAGLFNVTDPANTGTAVAIIHEGTDASGKGLYVQTAGAVGLVVDANNGAAPAASFIGAVTIKGNLTRENSATADTGTMLRFRGVFANSALVLNPEEGDIFKDNNGADAGTYIYTAGAWVSF